MSATRPMTLRSTAGGWIPRATARGWTRPNRRDLARALAAKRAAMREQVRAQLQRQRARLPGRRGKPRRDRRGWGWAAVIALILLLLWLLRDCSDPPPEPEAPGAAVELGTGPAAPIVLLPAPIPDDPSVERRSRPAFRAEPPDPLPWIGALRSQVAARSPRLAACFVDAGRPGRLKWTASVSPTDGRASDHTIEPTLGSDGLTAVQRDCVIAVLSDPPYRLVADGRSTPSRVSVVIEF